MPKYLPFVPNDPIAAGGKPLGYVADPDRPRLYTVGHDGDDDGGQPLGPRPPGANEEQPGDFVVDLKRQPREEADADGEP